MEDLGNSAGCTSITLAAVLGCTDQHHACARVRTSASLSAIIREGFVSPWAGSFGSTMLSLCCLCWCYCFASVRSGLLTALGWKKEYFCPCWSLEILWAVLFLQACVWDFWTRVLYELHLNILSFKSNGLLKIHSLLHWAYTQIQGINKTAKTLCDHPLGIRVLWE